MGLKCSVGFGGIRILGYAAANHQGLELVRNICSFVL